MLPHWDGVYRRTDWSALSSMFCKAEKACTVALTETRPSDWTIMVMQLFLVWDYRGSQCSDNMQHGDESPKEN